MAEGKYYVTMNEKVELVLYAAYIMLKNRIFNINNFIFKTSTGKMEASTPSTKRQSKSHKKQKNTKAHSSNPHQYYHSFTTPAHNEIWLCSLGLAWKQLVQKHNFHPEFTQNSRGAIQTILGFTENDCSPDDINESVYFKSGISNQTVKIINADLDQKFGSFNPAKVDPIKYNEAILYGALFKNIQLKYPLFKIPGKIMHFQGQKVPCFEPMEKEQREQIFVVKYTGQDNFIIRVNLLENNSYMFLYRSREKTDISTVIETAMHSKEDLEPLTEADVFKIPRMNIHVSQYLSEIIELKGKVEGKDQVAEIAQCFETVNFELLGQPHRERMDTMILSIPEQERPSLKSRRMALRGPFWLVLIEKGKYPHLVMYVNKHDEDTR